jgi:threonylcarbamoyladenosine tRNA methylthiotransferase MtaB
VSFATLGCRLNQVDTQEIQASLEARGFRTVAFEEPADVVVVNSCTVTARAEFSDRQMIRRAARHSPGGRIVVTGCWAQTSPADAAALPEVDLVVGNGDKHRLPDLVERLLAEQAAAGAAPLPVSGAGDAPIPAAGRGRGPARSRAFLKIQDGCQHRCAFCIVPFARGPSRSVDPTALVERVRGLVEAGHPEVVLTGIDMGHYGADLVPRTSLAALLRRITEVPALRWLRLSSVLPAYFTPELIEVVTTSPVLVPHLHVPLQSGSDRVLRAMRRPYNAALYRRLVERLSAALPELGLGTDVIAGFPGETDADFEATLALVDALPFSYLHVFPYSERKGTEAPRLVASGARAPIAERVVARRARALGARGRAKQQAFRRRLVGGVAEVLVLETRHRTSGALVGLTGNYVEVVFAGPDSLMRRLVRVRVTDVDAEHTVGTLEPALERGSAA